MIQEIKQFISTIDPNVDTQDLQTHKQLLDELDYCQGQHSKLFANSIDGLITIVANHVLELTNSEKYLYVEMMVASMEVCPSVLKKKTQRVERMYELICRVMANIKDQVVDLWYHPPEGFSEDDFDKIQQYDSDTALVCKFRSLMDRVSCIIGYPKMLSIIQPQAINFYKDGDWRWKNGVLMTLSQISEDVQLEKLNNVMSLVKMGLIDSHPKVRFAAIQVLGQYSDDLKPDFQQKYFNQLLPIILNGFEDNVQRVASHWMACMTNFIEDFSNTADIMQYANQIISKTCQFIERGNSTSKQNAISTLSSLVTVPSLFDKNTIQKPFEICHSILQAFSPQKNKQLINQTFECITITIASQPFHLVKDYIPFTIQIINEIGHKMDADYLVSGWHRLCATQNRFQNWKAPFIKVFTAIKTMTPQSSKIGLNSILATSDCFREQFYLFALDILSYLQTILSDSLSSEEQQLTMASVDAIENIMNNSKPSNPDQNWDKMVKSYVVEYIGKIANIIEEEQFKISEKLLDVMKQLLIGYPHLFYSEMISFYQFTMQMAEKLQQKKMLITTTNTQNVEIDIDEDLLQQKRQNDLEGINASKLCLPDIVREVLKNYPSQDVLIENIFVHITKSVSNAIDSQDFRYATYYLDNLLEDFNFEMLKNYWQKIYEYLSKFCSNPDARMRNSAVFGLGVFAQKTPSELVTLQIIQAWIQYIRQAYNVPQLETESKKVYGHCRDNCVSSTGKILKKYSKQFDLRFMYDKWVEALPLKFDFDQNRIQIQYLCEIIQKQPTILFENSPQIVNRLKQVFKICAQLCILYRKKKINEEKAKVLFMCKKALIVISTWNIFVQNEEQVIQSLTKADQIQIKELVSNPQMFSDFKNLM